MLLRLGYGVLGCAAIAGAVLVACSSDDDTTNDNTTDAGKTADGATANTTDGGTEAGPVLGAPITTATADNWTFVPFDDAFCANGATTGIGVNLGTSKRLVIYMEGGGACWSDLTCYTANTASYVQSGFGEDEFNTIIKTYGTGSQFDRTDANNPFKDANFIYVPYCTGDVHAGDNVITYPGAPGATHHVGRANVDAYMKRIAATFPDADRVVLSGSSAGGFGAAINYERVKGYYANTRIDLIDDSGPPFPQSDIGPYALWSSSWNVGPGLPAGCTACQSDISAILPYYYAKYTDARFALLTFDHDPTISDFFYGSSDATTEAHFNTSLQAVITTQFPTTNTNAHIFEAPGVSHTMFEYLDAPTAAAVPASQKPALPVTTGSSKTLLSFINDMESDSTTWANATVPTGH